MNTTHEISNEQIEQSWLPQEITLALGRIALDMTEIARMPRLPSGERENNADHSYMLAFIAPELSTALYPQLDPHLVCSFATVHDIVETKTGDVPTFQASPKDLEAKAARELVAMHELLGELPPYQAKLLRSYEEQVVPEARFVRMVDKLMPLVNDIHGQGDRIMHEDYGVRTLADLITSHEVLIARFQAMFPEFPELHTLHADLSRTFESTFIEAN